MTDLVPPYRADHVGSLLRPAAVTAARKAFFEDGAISRDDLSAIEDAARYADIDQLGIAPQCGFASTEEGNAITPDEQKAKLDLVVRTARAVWSEA